MQKRVLVLVVLAGLALASPAMAGAFDWWQWTGETSSDITDPTNWRWSRSSSYPYLGDPVLDPNSYGFGHPASFSDVTSQRYVIETAVPVDVTSTVSFTYGGTEIDAYADIRVHGSGNLTISGGSTANGVSNNSLEQYNRYVAGTPTMTNYGVTSYLYFYPTNSYTATGTVHVYDGGQFTIGAWANTNTSSNYCVSPGDVWGVGNTGIFIEGNAKVTVSGDYAAGGGGSGIGGGFLKIKGYDAASDINMGSISFNNAQAYPAFDPLGKSDAADLEVILDASNDGGLFNTVKVSGNLKLESPAEQTYTLGYPNPEDDVIPVDFLLSLDGYTPVEGGQVFAIVQLVGSGDLTDGVTTGALGDINAYGVSWDTTFTVSGVNFQLHQVYNGEKGIFLEQLGAIPEPATMSLLVIGGVAALIRRRRK
ncbi:MAG: PEP-CTERM sorting domain-containing protein [Planctomycetaceae bacterium]